MATRLTQVQSARLSRRAGGIDRLAGEYQRQIEDLTKDYSTGFSEYQAQVAKKMAPYESEVEKYKTEYTGYEKNIAGYKSRLKQYEDILKAYEAQPYEKVTPTYNPRAYTKYEGQTYAGDFYVNGMQISQYLASVGSPTQLTIGRYGEQGLRVGQEFSYLKPTPEKFTEAAPVAPKMPTAPSIAEFDTTQFEQKRTQFEEGYKREVGERRAARLQATRRSSRTMLGGTT